MPHWDTPRQRPRFEVAEVFRAHGEAYRKHHVLTAEQREVMIAIETCRTASLGGHADVCKNCGHVEASYNSCRNRHCPKCQALSQARWLAQRMERILPTHYFHLVFTLPRELRPLTLYNRRPIFDLLFKAASETLATLGEDPKWLGGRLGITAVLHTWTRELRFHPHLHCIVTGGGLSGDGQWQSTSPNFLFPVKVLSALFRGKLLHGLHRLNEKGQLDLSCLERTSSDFNDLVASLYRKDWVVYAKPPFGGPEAVFEYLGRYTHRVAISNARLIDFHDGRVTFATKNYRKASLDAETFIGRFLLHVLPKGFVKIRHYGLLAPYHAKTTLELARKELESLAITAKQGLSTKDCEQEKPHCEIGEPSAAVSTELEWTELMKSLTGEDVTLCPRCGGSMVRVGIHSIDDLQLPGRLDSS